MDWNLENELIIENGGMIRENFICGTDEAGRGPLAGDVYAAAVILPHGFLIEKLNDSKLLSEKRREDLYERIRDNALQFSIQSADIRTIKEMNILNASMKAMYESVALLGVKPDIILIDGNIARGFSEYNTKCVVRGDTLSPNIAAASILAKVERDRYMRIMHEMYPEYNFLHNKGYPTREHINKLLEIGPCPIHRADFIKHFFPDESDIYEQIKI